MNGHQHGGRVDTMRWHTATLSVFARVFAPVFTLPPSTRFCSSLGTLPAQWDGTDPLLGGHQAGRRSAPQAAHRRLRGGSR
jgi:hypothetical protein